MAASAEFIDRWVSDPGVVARLLLGALSEHEQRLLATRLVEHEPALRDGLRATLAPLTPPPEDERFAAACETAAVARDALALATARARLLDAARTGADLDAVVREYSYDDALRLAPSARRLFSWGLAEHLLARAGDEVTGDREARTALYLAAAVVDGLELLGAAGLLPRHATYAAALRREIAAARRAVG
ncbi:MAG: hypothetical protein AAGC60_17815 [Acidobacteriota bacterium]